MPHIENLQDSEVEIRELADKQLQDNEKLFLAEKKLQATLEKEQESKEELESRQLISLKSVHSLNWFTQRRWHLWVSLQLVLPMKLIIRLTLFPVAWYR